MGFFFIGHYCPYIHFVLPIINHILVYHHYGHFLLVKKINCTHTVIFVDALEMKKITACKHTITTNSSLSYIICQLSLWHVKLFPDHCHRSCTFINTNYALNIVNITPMKFVCLLTLLVRFGKGVDDSWKKRKQFSNNSTRNLSLKKKKSWHHW